MHQAQVLELGKLKGNRAWAGDYMACDLVPVGPADEGEIADYCFLPFHYALTHNFWGLAGLIPLLLAFNCLIPWPSGLRRFTKPMEILRLN